MATRILYGLMKHVPTYQMGPQCSSGDRYEGEDVIEISAMSSRWGCHQGTLPLAYDAGLSGFDHRCSEGQRTKNVSRDPVFSILSIQGCLKLSGGVWVKFGKRRY